MSSLKLLSKIQNSKATFIIIVTLAAIPFLMSKYFEFNISTPYDLGACIHSAKHILDGAKIGIDEKLASGTVPVLVSMLGVWFGGYSDIGPKVIQAILQVVALVFMFITMYKLFGTLPAVAGVIIASFYLSAPVIVNLGSLIEQCMISFMVMGISCFVLYQLNEKWWYAILSGAFLSWAPLFKPTGVSAIGAIGIFLICQLLLKGRTWKQTRRDTSLLFLGALIAVGPLYIWLMAGDMKVTLHYSPYFFVWKTVVNLLRVATDVGRVGKDSGYLSESREFIPFSKQWPVVLRYYSVLMLPIMLATTAIIARIARMILRVSSREKVETKTYERFVILFAVWWILDMASVWISPRSYPHYYLPLNASAAMLGGYLIALYSDKLKSTIHKVKWLAIGFIGFLLMILMSWHIVFGMKINPHSPKPYRKKQKGYVQRWVQISNRRRKNYKDSWEQVGWYIREHSQSTDKIYVWGWFPGIYVIAQRLSAVPRACTSEMHVYLSEKLSKVINEVLRSFQRQPPKFIVDTRKRHFPWDRPPLELWPKVKKGFMGAEETDFLPLDKDEITTYDKVWSQRLRERFGEDEALRYEAMKPFREFVMKNYRIVKKFGPHVLFVLKNLSVNKEY